VQMPPNHESRSPLMHPPHRPSDTRLAHTAMSKSARWTLSIRVACFRSIFRWRSRCEWSSLRRWRSATACPCSRTRRTSKSSTEKGVSAPNTCLAGNLSETLNRRRMRKNFSSVMATPALLGVRGLLPSPVSCPSCALTSSKALDTEPKFSERASASSTKESRIM